MYLAYVKYYMLYSDGVWLHCTDYVNVYFLFITGLSGK